MVTSLDVVVLVGHMSFSPFGWCNLDLSKVNDSQEGTNGFKNV